MNLIIQIGVQTVEYTVIGPRPEGSRVALTNQQAQLAIDLAYAHLSAGQEDALEGDPTLAEKAAWLLGRAQRAPADGFVQAAMRQRRRELQARPEGAREATIGTELG